MPTRFEDVSLIENSAFFDKDHLDRHHPDVALSGMSAAEHYLHLGGFIGRNPGSGFDSAAYLATYLDVAARGENPLLHYERFGRGECRSPMPAPAPGSGQSETAGICIDVVVPIFTGLERLKACLNALARAPCGYPVRAIVVTDGADKATTVWLRAACATLRSDKLRFELIEQPRDCGYTTALNAGLKASNAPFVVALGSDTIVTAWWLDGLLRCLMSDERLGIVGPLSNAARWQNVPGLYDADGGFAINTLPEGTSPEDMADIVRFASARIRPRSTFLNGFCVMIRRTVLDAVGYMDEATFPFGFGQQDDFCIRAQDAGFTLAIADAVYVYRARSQRIGLAERTALSKVASQGLRDKHGARKFDDLVTRNAQTGQMDKVRQSVKMAITASTAGDAQKTRDMISGQRVLFILPVQGGGGGAHSVVQEVTAMRRMGVDARIAVQDANISNFMQLYGDIPEAQDIFVGFSDDMLLVTAQRFDVVVATIFTSVRLVKRIVTALPWILPAYYAQDYEPRFFDPAEPHWQEAFDSYARIPGCLIFAKTLWICRQIEKHHNLSVAKVEPSIDHVVYRLSGPRVAAPDGTLCVAAMIRPRTPRRGAARTMELLAKLKAQFGATVTIRIFGCETDALEVADMRRDFDFVNHGILTRAQVAALLRSADMFVDLSDYQAFGRTGLEAMACGALAVVPQAGGGDEYAVDAVNALVVDSFDVEACVARLTDALKDRNMLARLQIAGIQTASKYSQRRAALSELSIFASGIIKHRAKHPKPARARVSLMPQMQHGQCSDVSGPGYVRLLSPYRQEALIGAWETDVTRGDMLPEPGSGDIAILHCDLPENLHPDFVRWNKEWHAAGGRLVYDIDDNLTNSAAMNARGYDGDADALARRALAYATAADLITVSTQNLMDAFSAFSHKTSLLPDFIDAHLWNLTDSNAALPAKHRSGPVRLGYVGAPGDLNDLSLAQAAVAAIEKSHDVQVEVIGAFQHIDPLFGKRIEMPQTGPYPNFVSWFQTVADWDIAILPLGAAPLSHAKGRLKFLECAALNTAIICSDTPEHRQVARSGENCLIVPNDVESWTRALEQLIGDAALRQRLAQTAYDDVRTRLTVQKNTQAYEAVLGKVLGADWHVRG
jgi:GT2 family glycosyltransferase/glycosyltransferase involved in cell wall biosynthesis